MCILFTRKNNNTQLVLVVANIHLLCVLCILSVIQLYIDFYVCVCTTTVWNFLHRVGNYSHVNQLLAAFSCVLFFIFVKKNLGSVFLFNSQFLWYMTVPLCSTFNARCNLVTICSYLYAWDIVPKSFSVSDPILL